MERVLQCNGRVDFPTRGPQAAANEGKPALGMGTTMVNIVKESGVGGPPAREPMPIPARLGSRIVLTNRVFWIVSRAVFTVPDKGVFKVLTTLLRLSTF